MTVTGSTQAFENRNGGSVGAVIGGAVAAVLAIIGVVIVVAIVMWRRRAAKRHVLEYQTSLCIFRYAHY